MKAAIIVLVLVILAVLVDGWLRQRRRATAARAAGTVRGELVVSAVQEQWRTGDANDDKLNREYDVRLAVDATLTGPGLAGRHRYDVTLVNRDAPSWPVPASPDVQPSDPTAIRVYVRPGAPFERFENGRPVTA
ncbi:hypothetical protein [Dactylosporangium cerinum]